MRLTCSTLVAMQKKHGMNWAVGGNISPQLKIALILNQSPHSNNIRASKHITWAIMTATINHIWRARNQMIFNHYKILAKHAMRVVRDQTRQIILLLHSLTRRYTKYIDIILH